MIRHFIRGTMSPLILPKGYGPRPAPRLSETTTFSPQRAVEPIETSLDRIPECVRLAESDEPRADYVYRDVLAIELKTVKPPTREVRERIYREMLREAGFVSSTRGMSFAQLAKFTKDPDLWKQRLETLFFRPIESPIRKAKQQIHVTRKATGVPYGVIVIDIDGDEATAPGDFDILLSKMIHRHVVRGDQEMASVSAIVMFHRNHVLRDISHGDGSLVQQIATEYGMERRGYEAFLVFLFDDLSRHGTMDTAYIDDFWYPDTNVAA